MVRKVKQFLPFYFYTTISVIWIWFATINEARSLASSLLLFIAGLLSWGMVEYILHRFIFHYQARSARMHSFLYKMHLAHHDDPKSLDQLFASLRMSLPIATTYCFLVWLVLGKWQAVSYVFAGLILGYFIYELLHYQAHHRAPRFRLFRYLKKYHMLHHHQESKLRFGVTSPLFDYLFGTFQPIDKQIHTRELQAGPGNLLH